MCYVACNHPIVDSKWYFKALIVLWRISVAWQKPPLFTEPPPLLTFSRRNGHGLRHLFECAMRWQATIADKCAAGLSTAVPQAARAGGRLSLVSMELWCAQRERYNILVCLYCHQRRMLFAAARSPWVYPCEGDGDAREAQWDYSGLIECV